MLVQYPFFLLLLLQLSSSMTVSNRSYQRGKRLVDRRVTHFEQNLAAVDDEEERLIPKQIEQIQSINRIQIGNKSVDTDSSSLPAAISGYPKVIYYVRHFQAKHNVDSSYQNVLDPDLTEYGFQQGSKIKFDGSELDLIICSPLSRTIQTYFSLFHDTEIRERIPFMLDADLQEIYASPADTARSKTALKQKFSYLSSTIDRDLEDNFNDKNNPLYSASSNRVNERVTRFHQRLLRERKEKNIMIITHGGWLSIELHGKQFGNGQIEKRIYRSPDDVASNSENKRNMKKISICFLLFAHWILLHPTCGYETK